MSGVLKIEIAESEETLRSLLAQLKSTQLAERVQILYWLKTRQAESVGHLASLVSHHRTTVSRWLSKYRQGGLKALLDIKRRQKEEGRGQKFSGSDGDLYPNRTGATYRRWGIKPKR